MFKVISIFCLLSISVPTTAFEVPPLIGHNNIRRLKLEKLSATKSGDQIPKNENIYDKFILPTFLNCACGLTQFQYQRDKVIPLAAGLVLDVGIGSGLNISFYDVSKVEKVIGLDPSLELKQMGEKMASKTAADNGLQVEFIIGSAEAMPFADDQFDSVVITYSLCTIPDAEAASHEIYRVLKPSGKLIFCEHGLAPDAGVAEWQGNIDPFWTKVAGGCHLNRDIPELIKRAGFTIETLEQMYLPSTPKFAGYNYWGVAVID